jgi:terminase small subunit-like protein
MEGVRSRSPEFRGEYAQAREVRCDNWAEEIVDIADHRDGDYEISKDGKAYQVREAVHRSKLRMEGRQWVMSRLLPQQWGDKQQINIKDDWSLLTEDERRRRADELILMIKDLKEPPQGPPPLVYRAEEATDEPEPGGIGWQHRSATGREG